MSNNDDAMLTVPLDQRSDERSSVRHLLTGTKEGRVRAGRIRLAGASPVPVDNQKVALKWALKGVGEIHGRHTRAAMEEKHEWLIPLAANQDPLGRAVKRNLLKGGNAAIAQNGKGKPGT